ncbi:MAG TPA: ATP-binding protein [Streptosporangiaceae bacterium]|jgi:signal transduction histidine kinase|nr:ATP-binding protein [Streptosporangiaceae bacterium]
MTTLSYLVEAVRGEVELPGDSEFRLELLSLEMSRLLDVIAREIPARHEAGQVGTVGLRSLAGEVTKLASATNQATVELLPGPEVSIQASPAVMWRVLTNLVDNAVRAAGPAGRVEVAVAHRAGSGHAIVDVVDDGPGFGDGPPGTAALGLQVVTTLLDSCGGRLRVYAPRAGAHVRVEIPVRVPAGAGNGHPGTGG